MLRRDSLRRACISVDRFVLIVQERSTRASTYEHHRLFAVVGRSNR